MDINIFSYDAMTDERLEGLLTRKESFVIEEIKRRHMYRAVRHLESAMDKKGYKSRVFTKARKVAMAGIATPNPVTFIAGAAAAIGTGLHNAVTWNPDYEIAKNLMTGSLTVTFKEKKPKKS